MDRSIFLETDVLDPEVDTQIKELIKEAISPTKSIIIYNDDVNTFEHVVTCLVAYCGHTLEQAEQCSLIIHYNGKYAVKSGSYEKLEPICTALLDNNINAEIK